MNKQVLLVGTRGNSNNRVVVSLYKYTWSVCFCCDCYRCSLTSMCFSNNSNFGKLNYYLGWVSERERTTYLVYHAFSIDSVYHSLYPPFCFARARAAAEGRDAKYTDIDFCKTPDKICSSEEHSELKWIAGFFYWMKVLKTLKVLACLLHIRWMWSYMLLTMPLFSIREGCTKL